MIDPWNRIMTNLLIAEDGVCSNVVNTEMDTPDEFPAIYVGIIDNSYSGPEDWWKMSVIAMRDTVINKDDKICQFRIVERQPKIAFVEGKMTDPSRGGFGSTGSK